MARQPRVVVPDLAHHVTQRGNNRRVVFRSVADYAFYTALLERYSRRHRLEILAYCLMPNHVHLIMVPPTRFAIADALQSSQMHYSRFYNRKNQRSGHLWESRYFSCPMDERHLYEAVRYVENNPVRAGLVTLAEQWTWSSAAAHAQNSPDRLVSGRISSLLNIEDWSSYLQERTDQELVKRLKIQTRKGLPLGGDDFVRQLENRLGLRLSRLPVGRPRLKQKPPISGKLGSVPNLPKLVPVWDL